MSVFTWGRKLSVKLYLFIAVAITLALTANVWLLPAAAQRATTRHERKREAERERTAQLQARMLRRQAFTAEAAPAKQRPPQARPGPTLPAELADLFAFTKAEPIFAPLDEREKTYDKPGEALEFFLKKRLAEGERELPVEKYFVAQAQMRQMTQFSSTLNRTLAAGEMVTRALGGEAADPVATWTPLGPGNIGGRTRAVLINPNDANVMYAAGVSGGVWKTVNGGQTWTPITDQLANLTVSSMAMEPGNPDTIYVGTGEGVSTFTFDTQGDFRGAGIFKTADGGASWTRLASTVNNENFYFVNDLVISPNDKNRVYAGTRTGVWRSLDGGANWTRILAPQNEDGDPINGGCLDLAMRANGQADLLFASCGTFEPASVYRNASAESSGNWAKVISEPGMGRTTLAIAPSNPDIIYALASSIEDNEYQQALYAVFRSTAGGAEGTWTAQVRNTNGNKLNRALLSIPQFAVATDCGLSRQDDYSGQGWFDLALAVDPLDANRVWVGGIDLFRSDDGGANWGVAGPSYVLASGFGKGPIHPDHHIILFHPQYNGGSNQTMFVGNDGGMYRTDNARAAVITTINGVCAAQAAGVMWRPLNNNYGVTQFYNGAVSADGKAYFGGTQDNGTVFGSDEAGINGWREVNGGDGGYAAFDPNNPSIIYSSNTEISIQKSTDGGRTFGSAIGGISDTGYFIAPFAVDPSDPQRLWTGGDYLWRTTAAGARWTRASAITPGFEKVSAIAIAPTDSNRLLVGMGDGYIMRQDKALTTTSLDAWPNTRPRRGYVSSVAFDPHNKEIGYATYSTFGGGAHVWRTTDGGAVWTAIDGAGADRLPDIPVHSLVVDPTNSARLYIGTDVGVFVSNDTGASWMVESTGFPNVITESLVVNIANGVTSVYAFTHGRGAWRAAINNNGCRYGLAPATVNVGTGASSGTINIKVEPGACAWTTASNASWLRITGSGSGSGRVTFEVDENTTFNARTATATVAGRSFTVIQPGRVDTDAPFVTVTDPAPLPPANNTGLINLAGIATDNNQIAAVTWETDRGASGVASLTAATGRWTATGIPLAAGNNTITIIARDAAGNLGRTMVTIASAPPAVVITVVGTGVRGTAGDGGQAAAAQISRPYQIDIDGAGNLYIADTDNHVVRKVTPTGVISTIAGRAGEHGFAGDGGSATAALLDTPAGVAVDGAGNVYISDTLNARIRKVTASTGIMSTFAGNGREGYGGDGGPATAASLNTPFAIDTDQAGNLLIADYSNHRIRKVTIADGKITTVAGNGTAGSSGDGGPATAAQLNLPLAVTVDKDGNIIICDSNNHRIRRVDANGQITTIVGRGQSGFAGDGGPATDALINTPNGAVVDGAGNLYFCDRGNGRIRRVAAGSNIITTIAGSGLRGFNGDGVAALATAFNLPNSLALDPLGNLYIADRENGRVRRLVFAAANDTAAPTIAITAPTSSGTLTTDAGQLTVSGTAQDNVGVYQVRWSNDRGGSGVAFGTSIWTVPNVPLQNGPNRLTLTAWDANGNATSATLLVNFNPARIVTTYAGTGTDGDSGDGGAAVAARISFPTSVAVDAQGNLYIVDSGNHRVRKVTPGGVMMAFAGNGMLGSSGDGGAATDATLNNPQAVAVDAQGNVYISDSGNNRIRRVNATDGKIATYAGTGADAFGGDGGPATQAQLSLPYGIALDAAGNLYIADNGNRRVRKVTASDGKITTVAGNGRLGNAGDGGPATQAQFQSPYGVTVDRNGVLYVVDDTDARIRRISPDRVISTFAGTGQIGYSGDGGPATSARLNFPSFLTTDAEGNVYFADFGNHRIRKVDVRTGVITTVVGTGTAGAGGDGSTPAGAQLNRPNDVTFDGQGNMYIADYGNQRVRKIVPTAGLRTAASVNAASFLGDALAAEAIAAAFGTNLATGVALADTLPLPTSLNGTAVRVRDAAGVERLAPLFFVAPTQVNFQVPPGTSNGTATVTITSGDGTVSTGTIAIANIAPGLFSANADGQGVAAAVVLRIKADGAQSFEPVFRFDAASNRFVAVPVDLGPETDQLFLIAFGTGLRGRNSLATSAAMVGGENAELLFAGPQGGFVGLDQANIRLNRALAGRGEVEVKLTLDGKTSNTVRINVK